MRCARCVLGGALAGWATAFGAMMLLLFGVLGPMVLLAGGDPTPPGGYLHLIRFYFAMSYVGAFMGAIGGFVWWVCARLGCVS